MTTRVYALSPHAILRHGLQALIEQHPARFEWLGGCENHFQACVEIERQRPDVVLLDLDTDLPEALVLIAAVANSLSRILLIARKHDPDRSDPALSAGAHGLILAQTDLPTLFEAIEKIHQGQLWMDPSTAARIIQQLRQKVTQAAHSTTDPPRGGKVSVLASLTPRERDIVTAIAALGAERGKNIAEHLQISESTLRNHLSAIYQKLGVNNRAALLSLLYRKGVLRSGGTGATRY